MKKLFILLIFILNAQNVFSQNWGDFIINKFYNKIDPFSIVKRGDFTGKSVTIEYTYKTWEYPYTLSPDILTEYYMNVMDSSAVDSVVCELVKSYKKIKRKTIHKITMVDHCIIQRTKIENNYDSDLMFISGEVTFFIRFKID